MSRHSIKIARDGIGNAFTNRVGTDALTALSSIPGVENLEVLQESDAEVDISYDWTGTEPFQETDELLSRFGLRWTS